MLEILSDNMETKCLNEHKILVVDNDTKDAFIYSMVLCSSGGGGWVRNWDGTETDRAMEVLQFVYNESGVRGELYVRS